ncbi:MAG: PAS domain-containing protein [Acidobacteriia bacterium]|nr:PAS domain-containing protein [Terriglobia bacterium]
MVERILLFADRSRKSFLLTGLVLCAVIVLADWKIRPTASLGLLLIFPVMLSAIVLPRMQIAVFAAVCSVLREVFGPIRGQPGYEPRLLLVWLAFLGAGLFVSEMKRNRALTLGHMKLLRAVVDTSPLGVLVLDAKGRVELANDSAARLFGYETPEQLQGERIKECLPTLAAALDRYESGLPLRASLACSGLRLDGDSFHANVWVSTFDGPVERQLAAVVWDESESLRTREVAGWEALVNTSRMVIGGYMHELRNLSWEAALVQKRLESYPGTAAQPDIQAMGSVLQGIRNIATTGMAAARVELSATTSLAPVIDELRILAGPTLSEMGIRLEVTIAPELPLVRVDHHTLLQVLLNLFRNACREMEEEEENEKEKTIRLEAAGEDGIVRLCFSDNGPPVPDAAQLFRPFASGSGSAGLGLFVSQALVRAYGGELLYAIRGGWPCFILELIPVPGDPSGS